MAKADRDVLIAGTIKNLENVRSSLATLSQALQRDGNYLWGTASGLERAINTIMLDLEAPQ